MGVNGQKLNFQANGMRWRDNGVETAWNSFLFSKIIAKASSDNIFVNKSGGGVKLSPMNLLRVPSPTPDLTPSPKSWQHRQIDRQTDTHTHTKTHE